MTDKKKHLPIICDIDVYAYGYLDGIIFERSQTLGTGGKKCDFHLYSAKS